MIRPGNELLTDRHRAAARWLPTTVVEYPPLRQQARQMLSCLGTTYRCESAFSYMTQIKNRLRSQTTDVHLKDQLILKSTMLEPQAASLPYFNKQPHCSHQML